jgi:hypothetical protein
MTPSEAAARWARVWQDAWPALDVDPILALYSPSLRHWSTPFREAVGLDGLRAYLVQVFGEERDIRAWFGAPLADAQPGAPAAVAWWATYLEDGREITIAGVSILRFDADGLVVSQWDAWNEVEGRREPPAGWGT